MWATGQGNRGDHNPDPRFRITGSVKIHGGKGQKGFSRSGDDIDDATEVVAFPGIQALLLPGAKLHYSTFPLSGRSAVAGC